MIVRVLLALSFAMGTASSLAQDHECRFYKVNATLLNISKEPSADSNFIDVLEDGDVACVTREQKVGDRTWVFIAHRLRKPGEQRVVEGWSSLGRLIPISRADSAASLSGASAPRPEADTGAGKQSSIRPEDILRFDDPITTGPYPVNGSSLRDLINTVPVFSPLEGLPEDLWKKHCSACHKWEQQSLCVQAGNYVKDPRQVLRKPHPFGGAEKIAMMKWSKSGCP